MQSVPRWGTHDSTDIGQRPPDRGPGANGTHGARAEGRGDLHAISATRAAFAVGLLTSPSVALAADSGPNPCEVLVALAVVIAVSTLMAWVAVLALRGP